MDSLLTGAILALALRTRHHDAILRRVGPAFILSGLAAVAVLLLQLAAPSHPGWPTWIAPSLLAVHYTVLALFFAALILWCLKPTAILRTFFSARSLRFFGKYSYGLYVLHLLFLADLLRFFRAEIALVTPSKLIGVAIAGLAVLVLSTAAAWLSFRFYEAPFLRLKRYFAYDQRKPARTAAQPLAEAAKL
jgi:peptidoglycan/LPS O-acetylase OafA/YrhL